MGVEELTDKVKAMFTREFAQTIGDDAAKSEVIFESLEVERGK